MIQADTSFLRSKFARRIFLLFILSAIVPVTLVAFLSYTHVATQLREQSYQQSQLTSKSLGMEIFRRLTLAQDDLITIGNGLERQHLADMGAAETVAQDAAPSLAAIAAMANTGEISELRGHVATLPALTDFQRQFLAAGRTVLVLVNSQGTGEDVLLVHAIERDNAAQGLLIGLVKTDFLWSLDDFLSDADQLVVLDVAGELIYASQPLNESMRSAIKPLLSAGISGHFQWSAGDATNFASFWALFMRSGFAAPNLVIVVSQPETVVLASIKNFQTIYVPLLLLAILIVSLIAAKQIRKKLVPLVTLRDATQRIATGDFAGRVNIKTDDEFAALGDAFNAMAGRLETQFTSLATMAEIDRLIHSSFDARFIISTVLGRLGELTPCKAAAILEFDEEQSGCGRISIRRNINGGTIDDRQVRLTHNEIRQLHESPSHLLCNIDSNGLSYLSAFVEDGTQAILFPIFIKERLTTVLIVIYGNETATAGEEINSLRKFADHVAVALSNAGWEERLYHQAHYDSLTNLPNRALLKDRLEQAIARAQLNHCRVGVLFLDLDRFKLVNDSLGHAAGDTMLKKVADILTSQVRNIDTVVRFGGDEFVIIIPDINGDGDAVFKLETVADKIFNVTNDEFEINRQLVRPKMSIGIALYPKDGLTPDELIKNADAAMYFAKSKGRARHEFFAPELNRAVLYRLQLEQDLRHALANDELLLYYQPMIDGSDGSLFGAEALIRWRHPKKGMVSPGEFIPIAEETGLIRDIGEWVMQTACRQIVSWRAAGFAPPPISVNVSPYQFQESNFVAIVSDILTQTQLEPEMLELEITESAVMVDADGSIGKLKELRHMGLRLSMDDFGTGYSSLSYLRRIPIHILKIDQSFIAVINEDEGAHAIVTATIGLAHKLGLEVIAEGVETEEQRNLLQHMQCNALQGYLFSKPMPAEQFAGHFLRANFRASLGDPSNHYKLRNVAS